MLVLIQRKATSEHKSHGLAETERKNLELRVGFWQVNIIHMCVVITEVSKSFPHGLRFKRRAD